MKLLDRLPIYRENTLITVQDEVVQVLKNQIIVWLSIGDVLRPFPAILDTGHSHNLSMARRHFDRWCGAELNQIGESKVRMNIIPHFKADVSLHRNVPNSHALRDAQPLVMDQGVAVIPDEMSAAPRLPILGLRTILRNELTLTINGKRGLVTLKKGLL